MTFNQKRDWTFSVGCANFAFGSKWGGGREVKIQFSGIPLVGHFSVSELPTKDLILKLRILTFVRNVEDFF